MPISECDRCGSQFYWHWEEAFDKFGFGDGDRQFETYQVADTLQDAGYEVDVREWGMHNTIIISIKKKGIEWIPHQAKIGYDDPRSFLPRRIVRLLDRQFPSNSLYRL